MWFNLVLVDVLIITIILFWILLYPGVIFIKWDLPDDMTDINGFMELKYCCIYGITSILLSVLFFSFALSTIYICVGCSSSVTLSSKFHLVSPNYGV